MNLLHRALGPIEAFTTAWRKSFTYGGKATRAEYWWFYLTNLIVVFVPLLALIVATNPRVGYIYLIAQIFPSLSIIVRRLRDIGKDWKWIFISLVPVIGGIWFIILMCQPSRHYGLKEVSDL